MNLRASFLALAFGLFAFAAQAADPIVIKFSHVVAPNTPKGKAAEYFKKLAEERTKGAVKVEVYPNSQLYKDREEIEALQLGAVQMLAPSLSKFGPLGVRQFELFDLPYIFPSKEVLYRVMDGDIGKSLFGMLGEKGIVGLAYWDNGFKQMSANRPLLVPQDYEGLRMRVQSSGVISAQMRALGALPVPLAFSETRQALAAGVVDGTENPVSNFWTQRMNEVQTDLSLTHHAWLGYAVVANQRFWRALRPTDRDLIKHALDEALSYGNQIATVQNEKALAALREAGTTRIHELTPEQRARMRIAVRAVYDGLSKRIGPTWLAQVNRALVAR